LPDTWTGFRTGLPQDVIEDLARRAREAEKLVRQQRAINQKNQRPMRVRVAVQPTFTRLCVRAAGSRAGHDRPEQGRARGQLRGSIEIRPADARASLLAVVKSIEGFADADASSVRFSLSGPADIRSFREDTSYVVDIGASDAKESSVPLQTRRHRSPRR
jgi:hypothetical protein